MWENSRTEQPPLFGGRPMPGSPCRFFFFSFFFFSGSALPKTVWRYRTWRNVMCMFQQSVHQNRNYGTWGQGGQQWYCCHALTWHRATRRVTAVKVPKKTRLRLTGRLSFCASTGWWNGQANWCFQTPFMTVFCRYCSWLVIRPGLFGVLICSPPESKLFVPFSALIAVLCNRTWVFHSHIFPVCTGLPLAPQSEFPERREPCQDKIPLLRDYFFNI